jgi:hypothetical protein
MPYALKHLGEDDVEATASIDEHLGEANLADHRADHEWISVWVLEMDPVVTPVKGDRDLRTAQGLYRVLKTELTSC